MKPRLLSIFFIYVFFVSKDKIYRFNLIAIMNILANNSHELPSLVLCEKQLKDVI